MNINNLSAEVRALKYYIGMDIGGTKCAVTLADETCRGFAAKTVFDTLTVRGPGAIIDELISGAKGLMDEAGISPADVIACGVSCGGPLDSEKGIILGPPNLPGWDEIPLADIITQKLGVPCRVRNDADACALAEWQFGAGRGCENMIFLTFGTGLGAGLILGGRLYTGSGTAGEAGHIRLGENGPEGYGKEGSFEGFCSGGGIARLGALMLAEYSGETILRNTVLTAKSIAQAANAGDELAVKIYEKSGEMLGRGLAVLIDLLAPEKIVIGSIFARSETLMRSSMERALKEEALAPALRKCEIVPAALGEEIGDYAAIGVAKEYGESIK